MFYREVCESQELEHSLFKPATVTQVLPTQPPAPLPPPGLDSSRQQYLYRHIREFVADEWKDTTCPVPGSVFPLTSAEPQPSTSSRDVRQEAASSSDEGEGDTAPKPARGRGRRGRGRGRGRGAKSLLSLAAWTTTEIAVNLGSQVQSTLDAA